MSGSVEERDRANNRRRRGLLQAEDHKEATPREEEEPAAVVERIQRIAANLDIHNLNEEELTALSAAVRRLAEVAKTQMRDRYIASRRAQVEDWEKRHAEVLDEAETVKNALPALRERIEEGEMGRDDVRAILDLFEQWLTVNAKYQATRRELTQAFDATDFDSMRSLTDALESLTADRNQASASISEALAIRPPGSSTPAEPTADADKLSDPTMTERADTLDEVAETADQAAPGTVVESEGVPESATAVTPTASVESEGDPDGAEPDSPTHPDDDEPVAEPEDDPARTDDGDDRSLQGIENALAMLIEHGRLGLAYHLSLAAQDAVPSSNAIKLVACNYVTDEHAPIAAELSELADALLQEAEADAEKPGWRSQAVLTTCAALAPALAAPGGPIAQLLAFLEPWLDDTPSLRAVARTAADVSITGVHLPIDLLREEDSLERWRRRESALRNDTKSWIENERQSKIRFHAATKVWKQMLDDWKRSNGQSSLGRMFSLLENPINDIDVDSVARISEHWRDHGDKEIDRIDRENRSWKSTNKIEGPARLSLRNKVEQALAVCDRWLRLIEERPDKRLPFHTEQAKTLRTMVLNKIDPALAEIDAMLMHKAAGAQRVLRRYAALFNSAEDEKSRRPVGLTDLLNGDLLAHPDIVFDDTGRPSDSPVDLDVLWDLVKRETPDFGQAAIERANRGDFSGAEAAVDIAERTGRIDEVSADRSRAVVEGYRDQIQSELRSRITETSNRLDAAYAVGALPPETYEQQHDRIPLDDFSETNTFGPLFATLEEIDAKINDAQTDRRDELRRSLGRLRGLAREDRERIESAIDSRRFQVAEDFIERIESGQKLPAPEMTIGRPFDEFFPHFVEKYSVLRDREGDGIIHAKSVIVSRGSDDFIDASDLSEDGSRDGIDLLEAWVTLRDGQTTPGGLTALMRALGFAPKRVWRAEDETFAGERVFSLHVVPVADRGIAQLPDFGSRADGRYRLFAVRRRKTGEAIIREADKQNGGGSPPNIVLFFGILDADSRRSLARDFQTGEYHPTIVLDESLVVFLAAWAGERLSAFFDCVSAFTSSQPFEPDAAELPPEMFFDRAAARRAILAMSHDMAHFVYGGRRLGKTTLLADIAREYRTGRRGASSKELVLLINLKGSGIGKTHPTEDLWRFFAAALAEHRVVGSQTRRAESVRRGVKQWLDKEQGRRVLLLVDEADAFLDAECRPDQDYRVLQQVKTLMEETERRFKVVFAGLHNVQRAARDPNTPLAHLGEAIRIGPMLPENDHDAIEKLIRDPLEALGYRFVSNDSVIRIAAETAYYPALAQQFCKELLKTLREEAYVLGEAGPPYPIHPDLVDRVFNAPETRDRIRNLFRWTIELDPRYEFLTYLIARHSLDNENALLQTMSIDDIRNAALKEWRQGFDSDASFWTFEVLLEEMVGLGILKEKADKEYAIRTRNLRMLLGNDDEIERRFTDAKNREAPRIRDRTQFRRTLEDGTPSSLTAHQESRLLSSRYAVGIVFGTQLAGLHRVGDSLRGAAANWDDRLFVEEVASGASPRSALRRALRSRKPGIHVVLVDMRGAWDGEVLERARAFVGKHHWQERIVRPVFLCGPEDAWKWLSDPVPSDERVRFRDVWLGPCGRDFTPTWLKDQESRAYADLGKPHQAVDDPWPLVVETAANYKQLESIDEAIEMALKDDEDNRQVSDVIRISEATDTALRLLSTFAGEAMTADFLSDLSMDEGAAISPEEVIYFFNWASRLGVVCRDENGYRLDSTYAEALKRVFGG